MPATAAALFALVAGCSIVFASPNTRAFGRLLIRENGPIEIATFLAFIIGGLIALHVAWRAHRSGITGALLVMIGLFSMAWVFAGMEEVSWGQSLLGFSSPAIVQRINVQHELNVHNLEGIQNLHSFLLFGLGVIGLVLAAVIDRRGYSELRVPVNTRVCLGVVAVLGLFDWITDNFPFGNVADTVIGMLAEVNELVLALAGLLFAIALARRIGAGVRGRNQARQPSPQLG